MKNFRPRTVIEYMQILWRRKILIILLALAIAIASYNAMEIVKNVYEANALVAISIQSNEEKNAVDVQLSSVNQHLVSRATLEPIVKRYNLYGNKTNLEAAINMLRQDLKIETKVRDYYPQFPISFTVTYRHTDPKLAMQVTNDLVSYFSVTNEELEKQRIGEANALDAAITGLETHLKQINEQQVAKEGLSGNLSVIKTQRANLISAIDNLNDKEFSLNKQISQKKNQINELEGSMHSLPTNSQEVARGNSAYGVLLTEKARLETQLKDQRSQYTEKNPKVLQTQAQIAEINKQIDQINEKNSQPNLINVLPEARELRSLQRELVNLETDLELIQRDLKRKRQALALLPEVEVTQADIASANINNNTSFSANSKDSGRSEEYNFLFNRYSSLIEKRDLMHRPIGAEQNANKGLFQIVDKAALPVEPVSPNKIKLLFLVIAMSILIGVMAAFVVEAPRLFRVHNEADVEYLLGVPVLGLIPETLTMSENRYNRKLYLIRVLSLFALTIALIPLLAILLKKFQIFQMLAK